MSTGTSIPRGDEDGDDLHLPEPIIHHIQSFLTTKQAAQTSLLSKSWYTCWLSRPTLDFDQRDFTNPESGFVSFVTRSISSYENLKLKLEKFNLRINVRRDHNLAALASEWILKALGMGVKYMCIESIEGNIPLPKEVFEAKSLIGLDATSCKVGEGGEVSCFNLEQLVFHSVSAPDGMIAEILSKCLLLEHVQLLNCESEPKGINMSKLLNLRKANFSLMYDLQDLSLGNTALGSVPVFMTLTDLLLHYVYIDSAILLGFSDLFPCIKNLTIHQCDSYERIFDISSKSLEFLACDTSFEVMKLDLPSLRRFEFNRESYSDFPSICFTQCSTEMESRIDLSSTLLDGVTDIIGLKRLLPSLRGSIVSLILRLYDELDPYLDDDGLDPYLDDDGLVPYLEDSPICAVEDLTLVYNSKKFTAHVIWYILLRSFRPKFVNHVLPSFRPKFVNNRTMRFWRMMMIQYGGGNVRGLPSIQGFDGAELESSQQTRPVWLHPFPWKTIYGDPTIPTHEGEVRFRLKWKPCAVSEARNC